MCLWLHVNNRRSRCLQTKIVVLRLRQRFSKGKMSGEILGEALGTTGLQRFQGVWGWNASFLTDYPQNINCLQSPRKDQETTSSNR